MHEFLEHYRGELATNGSAFRTFDDGVLVVFAETTFRTYVLFVVGDSAAGAIMGWMLGGRRVGQIVFVQKLWE